MNNLTYKPLTATPYKQNETYQELPPANPELARYIRCFWGSAKPYVMREEHSAGSIVVPDTCADIIYNIDHTDNEVTGMFCGINDAAFSSVDDRKCGHLISTFAVRFYAWGVYPFVQDSLRGTVNRFYDIQCGFAWLDRMLRQQLFEKPSLAERAGTVEAMFLRRMSVPGTGILGKGMQAVEISNSARIRENSVIERAVAQILLHKGAVNAEELAGDCFVSSRQMERLFHEYIGLTPKKLCNLVRYQCLWRDIMCDSGFQAADAAYRYGYADQSHLLREFKRHHGMDIRQARAYAYDNVGNIQYDSGR